jgi:hypothetical protein
MIAGDIFLRPPGEMEITENENPPNEFTPDEYTSAYKKFVVTRKMNMMGRQERVLAIDGDYIYILPSEQRNIFDSVKTVNSSSFYVLIISVDIFPC